VMHLAMKTLAQLQLICAKQLGKTPGLNYNNKWARSVINPDLSTNFTGEVTMAKFILNGKPMTADVESDTPLLWVIRDELDMTGTKFGCGIGTCGACTVHVGGRATRSCITPISSVEGAEITTIEGLSEKGDHPLQISWQKLQVPQCGYCQSGQIMQAAALLKDIPEPSDKDIDAVMGGNLCRCMTYVRIRSAIHEAANAIKESNDEQTA
jgi:isoquinoline 1-oxidoreductase alpha subunit